MIFAVFMGVSKPVTCKQSYTVRPWWPLQEGLRGHEASLCESGSHSQAPPRGAPLLLLGCPGDAVCSPRGWCSERLASAQSAVTWGAWCSGVSALGWGSPYTLFHSRALDKRSGQTTQVHSDLCVDAHAVHLLMSRRPKPRVCRTELSSSCGA